MSSNKKIRNRLNKLFEEIKQTEEPVVLPAEKRSEPTPAPAVELPQKPLYTRSLSPDTLIARPKVTVTESTYAGASTLAVPFQAGEMWNMLQLEHDTTYEWQEEEQNLVRQVADQLGLALQNAQLYQETQKRASELATLNEIVRAVSAQIGLKDVLETAYRQIRALVPVDAFIAALYDEKTNLVSYPLVIDEGIYYDEKPLPLTPTNLTGQTLISGRTIQQFRTPEEAAADTAPDGAIGNKQKTSGSLLFIPLKLGDKTIGCISVQSYTFFAYSPEDIALLESIANQLTIALQNAQLFEEAQRSARQMSAVAEIATSISAILDIQNILNSAAHLTQRRFGLYHAHILLVDKENQNLIVKACGWPEGDPHEGKPTDEHRISISAPKSAVARAAREKKAIINNNVHADPDWGGNPHLPNVQAELALPILAGDQLLGVLNVHSDQLNSFTDIDLSNMTTLAAQIGTSIQNVRRPVLIEPGAFQAIHLGQVADDAVHRARFQG